MDQVQIKIRGSRVHNGIQTVAVWKSEVVNRTIGISFISGRTHVTTNIQSARHTRNLVIQMLAAAFRVTSAEPPDILLYLFARAYTKRS